MITFPRMTRSAKSSGRPVSAGNVPQWIGIIFSRSRNSLHAKAAAILPELADLPILKHWSGLRPGTPENLPTIAAHPQIENLYLNTGHFRYGLTMAPGSAKIVAALICGEQPFLDPMPFACPQ